MRLVSILSILFLLIACGEDEIEIPTYGSKIVIDGWIETGKPANVILTYSTPYFSEIDSFSIYDFVNTRAKVTVSNGKSEEVLMLRPDQRYFPPFVYVGNNIKGEEGKVYNLTVEQPPHVFTASSTILPSPEVDSAWFEFKQGNDTLGTPYVTILDDPGVKNYYRVLARRYAIDKQFKPTLMPNISDVIFKEGSFNLQVYKGSDLDNIKDENIHFQKGDSIIIKVLSMEEAAYDYWNGFYNEQFNTGNPFADSKIKLKGNIQGGCLGIWAAYGKTEAGLKAK